MLYGCYRNNQIMIEPKDFLELCTTWIDPDDGSTISALVNAGPDELSKLGIFPALIITPDYDEAYQSVSVVKWEFNPKESRFEKNNIIQDRNPDIVRDEQLQKVRDRCREQIYSIISQEHQLDVALGIIPDLGYTDWIAAMIAESNRCEDLYISAKTIDDLKKVIPNFPEYQAPKG